MNSNTDLPTLVGRAQVAMVSALNSSMMNDDVLAMHQLIGGALRAHEEIECQRAILREALAAILTLEGVAAFASLPGAYDMGLTDRIAEHLAFSDNRALVGADAEGGDA